MSAFQKRRFDNIQRSLAYRHLSPKERAHLHEELHAANPFRWETWDRIQDGLKALGYVKKADASNGCGISMYTLPGTADPTELLQSIGLTKEGEAWVGTRFHIRVERARNGGMKAIMLTHPNDGPWVERAERYFSSL